MQKWWPANENTWKEFVDVENAQEAEFREPYADKANDGWSLINVLRAALCPLMSWWTYPKVWTFCFGFFYWTGASSIWT